jgi:hypothetical protein
MANYVSWIEKTVSYTSRFSINQCSEGV